MHPLKSAVLHHRLDDIARLVASAREQDAPTVDALMRLARELGNDYTLTRLARLFHHTPAGFSAKALLRARLSDLAYNHFGGGAPHLAAQRMWKQVFHREDFGFSMSEPDFVLDEEQRKDVRFLLDLAGIHTQAELVDLSAQAGEA